jgi:hypothetical protein
VIVVRIIDRHGDHFLGHHGDRLPRSISYAQTLRAAMNDAAEWLACWRGDGYPFREQFRKQKKHCQRAEHERRRKSLVAVRERIASRKAGMSMAVAAHEVQG